jgi:hypothetical protein
LGVFVSQLNAPLCVRPLVLLALALGAVGCGPKAGSPGPVAVVTPAAEEGPKVAAKIELYDAKVTRLEPTYVQLEVKYRFTEGRPDTAYTCILSLPDVSEQGFKLMESFALKPEGVLRDKFRLSKPAGKSFEIHMGESASSSHPYLQRSNVVKGAIE